MHAVVIDVARNCADLTGAHSTEITLDTPHPVIGLITEWTDDSGSVEQRDEDSDLGGAMRLGEQVCVLNQAPRRACLWPIYGARAPSASLRSE